MKHFITTFIVITLLTSGNVGAKETKAPTVTDTNCKDSIHVKVNGLVCDFCARALEKVFGKREAVAGVTIDLDNGLVKVLMKPGQTMDDDTLTKLITDSGYNVRSIDKAC